MNVPPHPHPQISLSSTCKKLVLFILISLSMLSISIELDFLSLQFIVNAKSRWQNHYQEAGILWLATQLLDVDFPRCDV